MMHLKQIFGTGNRAQAEIPVIRSTEDAAEDLLLPPLSRVRQVVCWKLDIAAMTSDVERRMGSLGYHGLKTGLAVGCYLGVSATVRFWDDGMETAMAALGFVCTTALVGAAGQSWRRCSVLSRTGPYCERLKEIRAGLQAFDDIKPREVELIEAIDYHLSRWQPFVRNRA